MRPLTSNLPKPLVLLNGKPILEHTINFYINQGFDDFVLCTGFNAGAIDEFVSSRRFNACIEISNAGEDAGILSRMYLANDLIDEKAVIAYGDTFINIDLNDILKRHNESGAEATITVADIRSPFGLVETAGNNRVISYEEKPVFSYYVGHMILEKRAFDGIGSDLLSMPDGEGLIAFFQELIRNNKLNAYEHRGLKITFNTFYERQKAEEEFIKYFTEQEE